MIEIPYDQRLILAEQFIKPGAVFRFFSNQTYPPKVKYHIVLVETCGKVYYVFTNTNLRDYQRNNSGLFGLQIEVESDSCFSGSCFIDCARIYSISLSELSHEIAIDFKAHMGTLPPEICEEIKQAAQNDSIILSNIEKSYFSNL